jgi:hypothetical protein
MTIYPYIPSTLTINGITVSAEVIIQVINNMTNPDPTRWYRYERTGDIITVETKVEPQTPPTVYDLEDHRK